MKKGNGRRCGCYSPVASPFNDTSKSKAEPTRMILPGKPTSKNAKGITCWRGFGVLGPFAFSGMNNVGSVLCATPKSLAPRDGVFITTSPVQWVVRAASRIAFYFIRSAMTGLMPSVLLYQNRVPARRRSKGLSWVRGNSHAQFLEGWATARLPGYSVHRVNTEAQCHRHCAPTGHKDAHPRTRASQEPTGHHQNKIAGDGWNCSATLKRLAILVFLDRSLLLFSKVSA